MTFAYSRSWLVRTDAIPLTPNLPLDERWHTGKAVSAYFDNLLPHFYRHWGVNPISVAKALYRNMSTAKIGRASCRERV